jgi:hypothetical protein
MNREHGSFRKLFFIDERNEWYSSFRVRNWKVFQKLKSVIQHVSYPMVGGVSSQSTCTCSHSCPAGCSPVSSWVHNDATQCCTTDADECHAEFEVVSSADEWSSMSSPETRIIIIGVLFYNTENTENTWELQNGYMGTSSENRKLFVRRWLFPLPQVGLHLQILPVPFLFLGKCVFLSLLLYLLLHIVNSAIFIATRHWTVCKPWSVHTPHNRAFGTPLVTMSCTPTTWTTRTQFCTWLGDFLCDERYDKLGTFFVSPSHNCIIQASPYFFKWHTTRSQFPVSYTSNSVAGAVCQHGRTSVVRISSRRTNALTNKRYVAIGIWQRYILVQAETDHRLTMTVLQ